MNVVSPAFRNPCLFAALAASLLVGCGPKKPLQTHDPAPVTTAPPPRPTITFQADPTSIAKGETSTLSWSTTNATQVTIAPEVGTVTAEGSTKVTPADSVTYTLSASGPGGSADASVRITIAEA